ncbi:MAG: S9 family peptidase [Acidobacteriota bacterium]
MRVVRLAVAVVFVGVLAWGPVSFAASSGRAFEINDYYRTAFAGSPEVDASDSRVVFAVRRYNLEEGASWSEIWTMASDGTDLRQMTTGRHNDTSPVFSPDGRNILFLSDRSDGTDQLFLLPVDGGEARRLTHFPMDLSEPRWSPDGKWIAVWATVYPECGADTACNSRIVKSVDKGKLKVHLADALLYRHWTSWRDGKYAHILLVDADSGEIVRDLTPGKWDSPTFSLSGERGYDFSPDSQELCYVSNHDPDPASSTNADLWVVPIDKNPTTETARNLTKENPGWDGSPLYSPDGRFIAYRSQATPGFESDLYRIALYDRTRRSIQYLTDRANFDNWVDEIAWPSDSASIYFQAEYHGRNPLYRIEVGSRTITPVLTDGTIGGWRLLTKQDSVVYMRRKVGNPPEIFRSSLNDAAPQQLTEFNEALMEEVDIRPAEELWVNGDGDYKVQVFIVKPHGFDPNERYPLILNVHGGPQSQWMDSYRGDWQVYPGKGYVVAFANPTGSTGFGQDFTDAISKDWGGRVFRDLMKVTDVLEKLPYVDPQRMGSMGWSYGGYMMMWFEGHTTRFASSAAMMGVYDLTAMYGATEELWFPQWDLGGTPWTSDLYRKWSPSEFVPEFKTPCLVITGEKDFRVPYTQSLEYFTGLQKMKVPSRLIVYRNAGHWPNWYEMAFYYDVHLDWFHRWLGGGEAPYDVTRFARNEVFEKKSDGTEK